MGTVILLKICLLCILFFVSACFACSETALFSLGKVRLHRIRGETHDRSVRRIGRLLDDPKRLLITILIGNELTNVLASTLTASITDTVFAQLLGPDEHRRYLVLETILATALFVPILFLFGEYTPKTIGIRDPEKFSRLFAPPLEIFAKIITPLRWIMESLAGMILRVTLGPYSLQEGAVSEKDFRTLIDLGKEQGEIGESEREFIHNIFDFGDTTVSAVMTPRTDMFCVRVDQQWDDLLSAVADRHYSRIPVYENDKDNIVGVLYSKDLLAVDPLGAGKAEFDLRSVLRTPYFIPHSKMANDLFREFQFHRVHMAIVVDEYGGVAGLVTMEDLLESLFGEILDEYDPEEFTMRTVDERTVVISARMTIGEFNWRLGARLSQEEYDTMGGFVFGLFGRLPNEGDQVSYEGFTFEVQKMSGTRILELKVWHEERDAPETQGKE